MREPDGLTWCQRGNLSPLQSVMDPSDEVGLKNQYLNTIHHVALSRMLPGLSGCKVLDLGCGPGRFWEWLHSCGAIVTGIDSAKHLPNLSYGTYCEGNILDPLPFDDNTFDIVMSVWVLQYLYRDELLKVVNEIKRVIKPYGSIVIIEQMSYDGTGGIVPRSTHVYTTMFPESLMVDIHPLLQYDSYIPSIAKRGWIPQELFSILARLHLEFVDERIPYPGYLDTAIAFYGVKK